jgi:hypothetical protein
VHGEGPLTVRAVFLTYLAVLLVGLAYFTALGLLHR